PKARPPDGGARPVAAAHLGATQEPVVLDRCARRAANLTTGGGNPRLRAAPGAGERDHATAREQLDQRGDVACLTRRWDRSAGHVRLSVIHEISRSGDQVLAMPSGSTHARSAWSVA